MQRQLTTLIGVIFTSVPGIVFNSDQEVTTTSTGVIGEHIVLRPSRKSRTVLGLKVPEDISAVCCRAGARRRFAQIYIRLGN